MENLNEQAEMALGYCQIFAENIEPWLQGTNSVTGWFKAFIMSEEFASSSSKSKKEAFESYEHLKDFLNQLDKMQLEQS